MSKFIESEKDISLKKLERFGKYCEKHRKELVGFLKNIKSKKNRIVGYGAPGRGTILLNYCKIGKHHLDYIVDVSPLRSGKLMPGVHVPIFSPEIARKNPPEFFLVLAWNYAKSIMDQEKELVRKGVRFIIPFPKIRIEPKR